MCTEEFSVFGFVEFRETLGYTYSVHNPANLLEGSSENCAKSCIERAGCTSFYMENGDCFITMGKASIHFVGAQGSEEDSDGSDGESDGRTSPLPSFEPSGQLSEFCPTSSAFSAGYSRVSEFSCKFATTLETEALIDSIVERNNVSDVVYKTWMHETCCVDAGTCCNGTDFEGCCGSDRPVRSVSRFVNLESGNPGGIEATETQGAWTWVRFQMKTYTREGFPDQRNQKSKKKEDVTFLEARDVKITSCFVSW